MTMSIETLQLLQHLLNGVTLNVGAEDFEETAHVVLEARRELALAIEKAVQ